MVSQKSIIIMCVTVALMLLLPILTALVFRRKFQVKLVPLLTGAALFFLFTQVLEKLLHTIVLKPNLNGTSALQQHSPVLYILYGALAAGVFEETARFIGFHFLKKKFLGIGTAIAYGIGHGGLEVLIIALGALSQLMLAFSINSGSSQVLSLIPKATVQALIHTSGLSIFLGFVERVPAFAIQICLSIVVWLAVNQAGKKWFYPLAIGIHAAVDFSAGLYSVGFVKSDVLIEAILFVEALLLVYFVIRYLKKNSTAFQLTDMVQSGNYY